MTSANDIITDALQKLGIYAPNQTLTSDDAALGFAQLNNLLDQWLDDSIYLYQLKTIVGYVSAQQSGYTVGPGGLIDTVRPNRILVGAGMGSITVGGVTTLLDSVSKIEWDAIYEPAVDVASPMLATPTVMFYDPQFPFGWLNLAPIPSVAGTISFKGYYGLGSFATPSTEYVLTPGEEQALKTNLALVLNPYFGGSAVTPELLAEAQQAKTTLTLTNRLSRAMSKRNREPVATGTTPR